MKKTTFYLLAVIFAAFTVFMVSCQKDDKKDKDDDPILEEPGLDIAQIDGTLSPVEGSLVNMADLEVVTFANGASLSADGSFSVASVDANSYQLLLFNEAGSENIVYMGLHDPVTGSVAANDTTTALGLTMLNPFAMYADYHDMTDYINQVKNNQRFHQLVSLVREIHTVNPNSLFDYDANPGLYQLAFQIMKETMEAMDTKTGVHKSMDESVVPTIANGTGTNINFVNPRHVWYAGAIYPDAGAQQDGLAHLNRVESLVSFNWAWPPLTMSEPAITPYDLGDGYYKIHLAMGVDFSKITDTDAIGRGTLLNTAQTTLYILKIAVGNMPMPNIITLPNYITINMGHILAFNQAQQQGDVPGLIMAFGDVLLDNSDGIAYWIWQEYNNDAAAHFVKSISGIIKNVSFVFKVLGFVNEEVPFIYDLLAAPREVTYFITQENGQIVSQSENNPPVAEFTIYPPAGTIETVFEFDASQTTDDTDNFSELQFRWDYYGNGTWDKDWGFHPVVNYSYSENGSYNVVLEVRDTEGLVGQVSHRVNVGGGAGTATHVKLFQDNLPWSTNAMVDMLHSLGFSEGTGSLQYQIIPSTEMGTTPLVPGEDLVIIANDQNQNFYNNYAAHQIRFNNFVYQGGSLFWEACDEGWAGGSMATAGVILPGNISAHLNFSNYNYVVNPDLPLVSGAPSEMWHNFASHEGFSNLPEGATVYTVDDNNMPTLVEFNLGAGWVLITGQPLEHQYVYGNDMQDFLPRIVSHFTGQTITKDLPARNQKFPGRPSYTGNR